MAGEKEMPKLSFHYFLPLVGFIITLFWTVAQVAPSDMDKHLCEFIGRYMPEVPEDCQARDLIISIIQTAFYIVLFLFFVDMSIICFRKYQKWRCDTDISSPLPIYLDDHHESGPVEIVYDNECNFEHKSGYPYRRTSTAILSGRPLERHSVHEFYIGVHNKSLDKSIKNVRVFAECKRYGSLFDAYLLCERTGSDAADIPPRMTDYYMLGKGVDSSDVGLSSPVANPSHEYMQLVREFEDPSLGFVIFGKDKMLMLLNYTDIEINITVFSDDEAPVVELFTLDTKKRVSLFRHEDFQDTELQLG
jgi:hypothetical protein